MVSWTSAGLYPASIIRATAARQAAVSFAFPSVSACITACNAPAQALSSFATRGRVGCLLSPAEHPNSRTSIGFCLRGSSRGAQVSGLTAEIDDENPFQSITYARQKQT